MKTYGQSRSVRRQKGAVLAISMIFLIIVTLIAVYAANTATVDVRMARNMQAQIESTQAADAGLNAAIETLAPLTGDVLFTATGTPTAVSIGSQLNNLNTGSSSVAVTIAYMGKDVTPSSKPSGQTIRPCFFHRVVSVHDTADAGTAVAARVKQCTLPME